MGMLAEIRAEQSLKENKPLNPEFSFGSQGKLHEDQIAKTKNAFR